MLSEKFTRLFFPLKETPFIFINLLSSSSLPPPDFSLQYNKLIPYTEMYKILVIQLM